MARSLRSKRRRKLLVIKRERYGKKELIRLRKMLGLPTGEDVPNSEVKTEPEISEIANVVPVNDVYQFRNIFYQDATEVEEDDDEGVIKMKRTFKIRKSHRPNARILDPKKSKHRDKPEPSSRTEEEQMDHDNVRHHNRKTLRDQYGNYPEWMNQKTVKMLAKKSKKAKRLERKKKYQMLCKKGLRKYSKETMETETVGLDEAITKLQKVEVGYPKKAQ